MSRRLMVILAFALVVGLTIPAFAEVQNVKVSGDITALGISRFGFDPDVQKGDDERSYAASIVRLRVDADLTENVGTTVRLLNERDWSQETASANDTDAQTGNADIVLDLAYVSLKEFLYSPLTLTIGRQELHFGNDLIMGDPDTNNQSSGTSLTDQDLSSKKAFNAVRATLDYKPLVIDLFWAKVDENRVAVTTNAQSEDDDIDVLGANARYDFGGKWKTIGEAYLITKVDQANTTNNTQKEKINNIGLRAEVTPLERLMLQAEGAFQFGRNLENTSIKDHQAVAAQGVARYALNMKYNPVLMLIYSYFSGDDIASASVPNLDDQSRGWDPMFENQMLGHIGNAIADQSNLHVLDIRTSLNPIEDLTLTLDYVLLEFAKRGSDGDTLTIRTPNGVDGTASIRRKNGDNTMGSELDVNLVYDYTEDVQLGLLAGWFFPGPGLDPGSRINEVIASCKVAF